MKNAATKQMFFVIVLFIIKPLLVSDKQIQTLFIKLKYSFDFGFAVSYSLLLPV